MPVRSKTNPDGLEENYFEPTEWFLRSEKCIKIFFRLDEEFIGIKSPGQSDDEAEALSVEDARKRWQALLKEGYSQIITKDEPKKYYRPKATTTEQLDEPSKAYWGENSGHYSNVGIPLEAPEWTYRENEEGSAGYDSDDYESQQGY